MVPVVNCANSVPGTKATVAEQTPEPADVWETTAIAGAR